jgi:DNA-directed RNA polymerase specialized sigma24 family protein
MISSDCGEAAAPLPHNQLEQREIRQRIDEAIGKLSSDIAQLRNEGNGGLQYSEIAEILNCSLVL